MVVRTERNRGRHKLKLRTVAILTVLLSLSFACLQASWSRPCVNCPKKQTGLDPYSNGNTYNPMGSIGNGQAPTLQGGTGNTTLQVGTESTLLMGGTQGALLQAGVEREGGPVNILFLIDSSNSMREKINSGTDSNKKEAKMEAAKKVLEETLSRIPNEINLGLRVFGNGFRGDMTDCQQSTLLVPLGRNNRKAIIEAVRGMSPHGLTPLTYALMQAENDLRYCNGPKTVILISDGVETCGGDPCPYVDRLSRVLGVKMKIDIVGLGLRRDRSAQEQLNCIAEKSGGKYYDANTAADLVNSIANSVRQAISGKVLTRLKGPVINDTVPADLAPLPNSKPAPPPRPAPALDDNNLPADLAPASQPRR